MDKISSIRRHKNMSAIRSSDTSIELLVRRTLFAKGFRFRKNLRSLPGTPDIVFLKRKVAIFLDGCFWHRHTGCIDCHVPKTNSSFWESKIQKNVERDSKNRARLSEKGFLVLQYWECDIRSKLHTVIDEIENAINKRP